MPLRDNADIQYTSMWGAAIPLPQHEKADGTFVVTGENNPMPIMALGQIPTQEQSRLTPQDKVATAFSINAGATLTVATVPMSGYSALGYNSFASASHAHATTIWASPDGATRTGTVATVTATNQGRNLLGDVSAEYAIIEVTNSDASARTYDVWARKMNR